MKGNAVYTAKEKALLDIDVQIKSLITREVITNYIVYDQIME